jgi:hypothetical protein
LIALRKISIPKLWENYLLRGGIDAQNPPIALLSEFFPSKDEKDHFSVFLVESNAEAGPVAAAKCMAAGVGPARTIFATADVAALEGAGVVLRRSPGETLVPAIDDLHHDLLVPDQRTLAGVAAHFIHDAHVILEADDVRKAALKMAAAGDYDFADIAAHKSRRVPGLIWESTTSMVGKSQLRVAVP